MSIFDYTDADALGKVTAVDTGNVVVRVNDVDTLRRLQVNRLVLLQSSRPGEYLIGVVQKITRSTSGAGTLLVDADDELGEREENLVRVALIGTHKDRRGSEQHQFVRTLETVPEIDANCFAIEGTRLSAFMGVIARVTDDSQRLDLGTYALDESANAYLNGNKFFQRHAIVVGSTGAGKSWTTARIIEQVARLPDANAVVFDIHGEYTPLGSDSVQTLRVAGPGDLGNGKGLDDGVLYLPYWLLTYEAMVSIFVERSDQNAPNQAMLISRTVGEAKQRMLTGLNESGILDNFTVDSPIPFDLNEVVEELNRLDSQMVQGARGQRQGPYFGKLSRMISRLENRIADRRLGFLFDVPDETQEFGWLETLCAAIVGGAKNQPAGKGGVKIVDFSEVPSDVLPLIVSLIARLVFTLQQWASTDKRLPIALFCDEAHLYIPERFREDSVNQASVTIFERVAKEGRKYGVGLVVISQRPSEVSRTVLSQCNNVVSMRLTNADDQNVIRRLLPDSLGGFSELLPILDTGEALVVGDASLLPSRIRVTEPSTHPNSGTMDFWDIWSSGDSISDISRAVDGWRKQSRQA